jgi:enamine deaminase RidA (YjgF/YER057c/UK114 family)
MIIELALSCIKLLFLLIYFKCLIHLIIQLFHISLLISIEEKLYALGFELPSPPKSSGSYIPLVEVNGLIFVSGQIPLDTSSDPVTIKFHGKIGRDTTLEKGQNAAILCTLNALALLKDHLGSLEKIKKIVRLSAYVNCVEAFSDHPKVVNSASNLLERLFGEKGKHSRIAIGVESLPFGSTIEIDFIFSI